MVSRLDGSSNCKRKQSAIMLSSFSVSKSDSQNSQNKEDQEQDNAKSESRTLKKVMGLFSLGKWSSNGFATTRTQMQLYSAWYFCQHAGH